jgi:hypothetical protein
MNRRGFFSLVGKLVAVGAALKIHPRILAPVRNIFGRGGGGGGGAGGVVAGYGLTGGGYTVTAVGDNRTPWELTRDIGEVDE